MNEYAGYPKYRLAQSSTVDPFMMLVQAGKLFQQPRTIFHENREHAV